MNSKKLALLSGASCIAVLATYAWAASHEAKEAVAEEVTAKVEETAEPARLCIPMAEAESAAAAVVETDEASTEGSTGESSSSEVGTEDVAEEAPLPTCDADGNPPVAGSDDAANEETTEESAKTE